MRYILILLLLIGCASPQELTMKDLRIGTEGIALRFLDDQPPAKVMENDRFVMTFELHNRGAASAKSTALAVGIPQEYVDTDVAAATLNGQPTNLRFELEGKSVKNPKGGIALLMIPATTKPITTSKRQDVAITTQLCYDYETVAETGVCVNYNPAGYQLRLTSCKPRAVTFSSQGAPVAVTKIDVKPKYLPDGQMGSAFIVTILNKGSGRVVEMGQSDALCSATADLTKVWDRVMVTAVLGGREIRCKKNVIRLENNKGEAVCEGTTDPSASPYVAPLQIYLDYGYTQTLSKQFAVERIR
ncbi:hypothetical protein HY639_05430 [Candidatus Woesearchaeota archaeon]|nr:hypothetical protein [Candidatus Woesearchaeota archaeon]